jgi:hypothetical protein
MYVVRKSNGEKRYIDKMLYVGTATKISDAAKFHTVWHAWRFVFTLPVPEEWIPKKLKGT